MPRAKGASLTGVKVARGLQQVAQDSYPLDPLLRQPVNEIFELEREPDPHHRTPAQTH